MIELTAPEEPFRDAGEGVEGLLEAWLVDEGDPVTAGQPVADAIVVKTSFQVRAPCEGTIEAILVPKGDTFGAGAVLATIEEAAGPLPAGPEVAAAAAGGGVAAGGVAAGGMAGGAAAGSGATAAGTVQVPFTGLRGAVAREMALAWQVPRVAVGVEVDMTAALAAIQHERDAGRLSPTHAVLRSVALALREHPRLNARVTGDGVEVAPEINLGLAVSLSEGVIVPVIRKADTKSMLELAVEASSLAEAARAGSLPGSALRDGTFTVTTLGATGIDWFTPILNAPQAGILGVGRVADRVVARSGAALVVPTVLLTLVFDHRAVDGHPAAIFLASVRDRLERGEL